MPRLQEITKPRERWFVLTVAPQHELSVRQRLEAKGHEASVPVYVSRRRWSDRVKTITLPLFPGYVFCRFAEDGRVPVLNTPGVRSVVCFGSQLAHLDDADVERIHQLAKSGLELQPLAGLRTGMRVDIVEGPLLGLTGVLSHVNGDARVVVNVHMLNRAVAVQVSPEAVAPCEHVLSAIPA